MVQKITLAVLFTIFMTAVSGCHTIHGIGQDIESGGKAIEKSSGK